MVKTKTKKTSKTGTWLQPKFLGCGSGINPDFGSNSAYIMTPEDTMILLECGESVFSKLIHLRDYRRAKSLVIIMSHTHSDHSGSLGTTLLHNYNVMERPAYVIYGNLRQRYEIKGLLKGFGVPRQNVGLVPARKLMGTGARDAKQHHKVLGNNLLSVKMQPTPHVRQLACFTLQLGIKDGAEIFWSGDTSDMTWPLLHASADNCCVYLEGGMRHNPTHINIDDFDDKLIEYTKMASYSADEMRRRITFMHLDSVEARQRALDLGYKVAKVV